MSRREHYDFAQSEIWRKHVEKGILRCKDVRRTRAANILLLGLPKLESQQNGFGHSITANHDTIARASHISTNSVKKALEACSGVCIEYTPGQAVMNGAASQIRRLSIEEMTSPEKRNVTQHAHTPLLAESVAERLRSRELFYLGNKCTPNFNPQSTGRIYTSKPNIQGDAHRLNNLISNQTAYQWIFEVDFRAAEPTVLRHILKTRAQFAEQWPDDPYQEIATIRGIPREQAKPQFLAAFYTPNTRAAFLSLNILQTPFFGALCDAVEKLKEALWQQGKPSSRRGTRRHVTTLAGTRIEHRTGDKMHRGKLLSWLVQGTVADIVNGALRDLLDQEERQGWRVICPVHDSIIVAANRDCGTDVQGVMEDHAKRLGIEMKTGIESQRIAAPKIEMEAHT